MQPGRGRPRPLQAMCGVALHMRWQAAAPGAQPRTLHCSQVSPVTPIATASDNVLLAKLLGDLAGYTQLPVLRCA